MGLTGTLTFSADSTALTLTANAIADASAVATQQAMLSTLHLSAVLLEDSIPGSQYNGFAGGSSGWFYGWELLPQHVNMNYDDVARGIYPSFQGTPFCEGTIWSEGTIYSQTLTISLPASVSNKRNLHVVALLVKDDGTIANACNVFPSAVSNNVPLPISTPTHPVIVYDLNGRELGRGANTDAALQGVKGLAIVRTGDGRIKKVVK